VPKSGKKRREATRKKERPVGRVQQSVKLQVGPHFPIFLVFFIKKLVVWRWTWHFGRMGVQYPHFLKLAPTLERTKSSIPHGASKI
jgi:hypothetical protein